MKSLRVGPYSNWTGILKREGRDMRDFSLTEQKGHVRTQREGTICKERGLNRNQSFWHLDPGLLASKL